ncbi:MAG: hypothetical protein U0361_13165 [Nitrospiraceae bacterium]
MIAIAAWSLSFFRPASPIRGAGEAYPSEAFRGLAALGALLGMVNTQLGLFNLICCWMAAAPAVGPSA